ncbi:MAG: hypothetical protein COB38_11545 [Gammaproteobacteria bacterium]|nr:MAG: hypothetical protein COB38_11545 [Gammaproteobacteria bacterium]
MTNVHSLQERRAIKHKNRELNNQRMDDACDWVTKIDRRLTKREKKSLQNWLIEDQENLKLFLEVAKMWDKSSELSRLADVFPQETLSPKPLSIFVKSLAASILFVVSIGLYQISNLSEVVSGEIDLVEMDNNRILKTKIGESNTFILSDGSKIVLNTDTEARISFSHQIRFIDLKQGEIHIDVAHDKSRPLQVRVGDKIVQAIGTAFNIEVKNDLIELIVTDGKVIIKDALSLEIPTSDSPKLDGSTTTLSISISKPSISKTLVSKTLISVSKGEKINLEMTGEIKHKVLKVKPIEIVASLSWRQGNLIFRGESLEEAMIEISRYSDVTIHLADDPNLKNIQVAGMFRTGDIEGLLSMLKTSFNIEYKREKDNSIFLQLASSI